MAFKTIGVSVKGKEDVEELSKLVKDLKGAVKDLMKDLTKLGKGNNSMPNFKVKLALDTSLVYKQFRELKKDLEKQVIKIKAVEAPKIGSSKSSTDTFKQTAVQAEKATNSVNKLSDSVHASLRLLKSTGNSTAGTIFTRMREEIRVNAKEIGDDINHTKKLLTDLETIYYNKSRGKKTRGSSLNTSNFLTTEVLGHVSFNEDGTRQIRDQIQKMKGLTDETKAHAMALFQVEKRQKSLLHTVTDYINMWESISETLDRVNRFMASIVSNTAKWGLALPSRPILNLFSQMNREFLQFNRTLATTVGGSMVSLVRNSIQEAVSIARQGLSAIRQETVEISDATAIYRNNMSLLGFSEAETNRRTRDLGEFGRKSVYDAKDLLTQAGVYASFGREDANDIVKAIAGLVAQTANPNEGMERAGLQIQQMLTNQYLNQQDLRFMREKFNALGAREFNDALNRLAQSKGFANIGEATRQKAITGDEVLNIIKEIGGSAKFQNLVTTILTPKQALDNLRENIANALNFDSFDENGNLLSEAPLKKLYTEVVSFIRGISESVDTERFRGIVRAFGDNVSNGIRHFNEFITAWNTAFGSEFLNSLLVLGASLRDGFSMDGSRGLGDLINKLTQNLIPLMNSVGREAGDTLYTVFSKTLEFVTELSRVGGVLAEGNLSELIGNILSMYTNLVALGVDSGAFGALLAMSTAFFGMINSIITDQGNIEAVKPLVTAIQDLFLNIMNIATQLGTGDTSVIKIVADVFAYLVNTINSVISQVNNNVGGGTFQKALGNISSALKQILDALAEMAVQVATGAIEYLASNDGVKFLDSLVHFVKTASKAVIDFLTNAGDGDLSKGFDVITKWIERLLGFYETVLKTMAKFPEQTMFLFATTKILSFITSLFGGIVSTAEAFSNMGNLLGGLGIGKLFAKGKDFTKNWFSAKNIKGYAGAGDDVAKLVGNSADDVAKLALTSGDDVVKGAGMLGSLGGGLAKGAKALGKGLGGLALGFALDYANEKVQKSDTNGFLKGLTNIGVNTANYAMAGGGVGSLFAGIGAIPGAIAGGAFGLAKGFYESVLGGGKKPKKADDYFAEPGSRKWNQEQYEAKYSSMVTTMDNYSSQLVTYFGDQEEAFNNLKQRLIASGASFTSVNSKSLEQLQQMDIDIQEALKGGNFATNEAQRQALIKAIQEYNPSAQVAEKSLTELKQMATDLHTSTLEGSEQENLIKRAELQAKLGELVKKMNGASSEALTKVLENFDTMTTEEIEKALAEVEKDKTVGDLETKLDKHIKGLKAEIEKLDSIPQGAINSAQSQLNQALSLLGKDKFDEGDADSINASLTQLGIKDDEVRQAIVDKITKGEMTLQQAIDAVKGDITVDMEELKTAKTGLKDKTQESIDGAKGKLKEASDSIGKEGYADVDTGGLRNAYLSFVGWVDSVIEWAKGLFNNGSSSEKPKKSKKKATGGLVTAYRALGGVIPSYYSSGSIGGIDWTPRGTDTVPTMLTPGEYVLRKRAVDSLGLNFLNNLNQKGVQALQKMGQTTIINNVYNTNNAKINQSIDNKSQYLNGMNGLDRLMRYV